LDDFLREDKGALSPDKFTIRVSDADEFIPTGGPDKSTSKTNP
jgi:hypothetical protein